MAGSHRIELIHRTLKLLDRRNHALDGLLTKQDASVWPHGFRGAAATVGDYGCATRLSFQWHDAKILFAGKQQGPATTEVIADNIVALPTQKLHIWSG